MDSKKLTLGDLYSMAVGTTIGAGIVVLIGYAALFTGRSAWLAYIVAVVFGFINILPHLLASGIIRSKGGT